MAITPPVPVKWIATLAWIGSKRRAGSSLSWVAAENRDRSVDPIWQLLVRQLILVVHLALEAHQLGFEHGGHRLVPRLPVEIVQLLRIVHEIEQLPLILLPEVDQLVCQGGHTV